MRLFPAEFTVREVESGGRVLVTTMLEQRRVREATAIEPGVSDVPGYFTDGKTRDAKSPVIGEDQAIRAELSWQVSMGQAK